MSTFSEQDQLNELEQVFASHYFKMAPELSKLLKELKKCWQASPTTPISDKQLAERLFKSGDRDAKVRLKILRARAALHDYYRFSHHQPGDICVWLHREARRGHSGYYLLFEAFPGQYTGLSADIVDRFWNTQVVAKVVDAANERAAQTAGIVNIVFSNENDPVSNSQSTKKSASKVPGIWTGTGEVIGVFNLAKALDRARVESELLRSTTLSGEQTFHQDRIYVYIGSSLAMHALSELRELGRLRKKQRFFFQWGEDKSGKKRGEIYDIDAGSDAREKYYCETKVDPFVKTIFRHQ